MKKEALSRGFEEVKDLIRGSISADISEIVEAYEVFKTTPGIEIIEIKSLDKMYELRNITVLFTFN